MNCTHITWLKFEQLAESFRAHFVHKVAEYEDAIEKIVCVSEHRESIINLDCKIKTVEWWVSGKWNCNYSHTDVKKALIRPKNAIHNGQ